MRRRGVSYLAFGHIGKVSAWQHAALSLNGKSAS
jgi:hypothetical protein